MHLMHVEIIWCGRNEISCSRKRGLVIKIQEYTGMDLRFEVLEIRWLSDNCRIYMC